MCEYLDLPAPATSAEILYQHCQHCQRPNSHEIRRLDPLPAPYQLCNQTRKWCGPRARARFKVGLLILAAIGCVYPVDQRTSGRAGGEPQPQRRVGAPVVASLPSQTVNCLWSM